ncbi:MAG TPA: NAD-binding protein [Candidatus Ozemobacteraceae bacterium]|nr:NAD-binding protein [Candidatus Ozemobacteraceae bacterium]
MNPLLSATGPRSPLVERRRYPRLRALIDHPWFGVFIFFLILLSIGLLVYEVFFSPSPSVLEWVHLTNDGLLLLFLVELILRWLCSATTRRFVASHWVEILAVIPMFRIFRLSRVFLLVRLLRVFSLGALMQRRLAVYSNALGHRWVEYLLIFGILLFALIFGSVGLAAYEVGPDSPLQSHSDAFWKALFSLITGEYADFPRSLGGKLVFCLLSLFAMGIFAMITGTISAVMIEKLKENAMLKSENPEDLSGHIVICGYSSKVAILIEEFLASEDFRSADFLLVSEHVDLEELRASNVPLNRIQVLREDFTRIETLRKANLNQARTAIILSEAGKGRSHSDIDARTILAALTIERLNKGIHTCAEIYQPEFIDHLKMGGVDDVVVQGDVSGRLLARLASTRGLQPFFKDLLTAKSGNHLKYVPVPQEYVGKPMNEVLPSLFRATGAILVGVRDLKQEVLINPQKRILATGDELLVICPPGA